MDKEFTKELSFEDMQGWAWSIIEIEKIETNYPLKLWHEAFIKVYKELKESAEKRSKEAYQLNSKLKKQGVSFRERKEVTGNKINYYNNFKRYKLKDNIYDHLWFSAIDSIERVGLESFIKINWDLLVDDVTIKGLKGGN